MSREITDPRRMAYRGALWFVNHTEDRMLAWDAINAILSGQTEKDFVAEKTLTTEQGRALISVAR